MKLIIVACAVCLRFGESYGTDGTNGVGAFAYDGPSGRYGGTYGLRDGQVVNQQGSFPPNFSPPTFPDLDDFFPEFFSNYENLLQENPFIVPPPFFRSSPFRRRFSKPLFRRTFDSIENQRLAYAAATKAFDLTSNRAGYNQYFAPSRFPYGGNFPRLDGFQGEPGFQQGFPGLDMSNSKRFENSAFAGAAIGPDFTHQVANINPANPNNPNVNKFSPVGGQPGGYKSVSSSSYVSTSNLNGKESSSRRAETVINDNGKITKYRVEN